MNATMNFCSLCGSLPCTCHDELGLLDNKNRSDLRVNGKAWSITDTIIDEGSNNEGNLQGKEFKHVSYDLSVLNFTDQNARGGSQSSDEEIVVGVEVQYQDSSESRDKSSDNNTAFLSFFGWKEEDEVEDDDKQIIKRTTKTKSVGGKTFVDMEEGGNGDDDEELSTFAITATTVKYVWIRARINIRVRGIGYSPLRETSNAIKKLPAAMIVLTFRSSDGISHPHTGEALDHCGSIASMSSSS